MLILTAGRDAFFGVQKVFQMERKLAVAGYPCYQRVLPGENIVVSHCHLARRGSSFAFTMKDVIPSFSTDFIVVPGKSWVCVSQARLTQ